MSAFNDMLNSAKNILCLSYNQNSTSLAVGTKTGYMLYDFGSIRDCMPIYESRGLTDICIIEKNFSTMLIAYVSLNSPRDVVIYNYHKGIEISTLNFTNTVLSVKLNRKNVVVCLEDSIHIYNLTSVRKEHVITNIPSNVKGLIAVSHGNSNSLLAYPVSSVAGDVQIFDALDKHAKTTIPAHTSQLAALAFDEDGEKLATASIKGTVIRVFKVTNCEILFEFRRGVKRCVEIHSLSFDTTKEFLCASSNTETVHIFKLSAAEPAEQIDEENEGWVEMFGRVLSQSAKYLPTQVSDVLTQQRSFAVVHLPFVDQKTACAISKIQNVQYVMVASMDGFLYIYELNTDVGGPCQLVKQHRLEGPFEYRDEPKSIKVRPKKEIPFQSLSSQEKTSIEETENGASNIHASNGILFGCDEMPPVLNKVE